MNPNQMTHEQKMAEMVARLAERMQNRRIRTVKEAAERDREQLIEMRRRGMPIQEVATAYQEILHSDGICAASLSYVERVVSEVTKDAIGARQTRHSRTKPESEPVPGMDGLIPVFRTVIGGREVDAVNARDLHAFLEVGKDFSTWIKDRIRKYGFEENQDVEVFTKIGENLQGGRPSLEYHLTLDMAKELSMVENNARGREARRYFIEIERRYYSGEAYRPAQASESLPEPEQPLELPGDSVDPCRGEHPSADSPVDMQESPFAADDREILHDFPNLLDALLPESVTTESFLRSAQAFYRAHLLLDPSLPYEDAIRRAFARAAELCGADLKRIAEAIAGPCKKRWF